jgi:hypothetical protein
MAMGHGDECPLLKRAGVRIGRIPDPKHLTDEEFRKVRDIIEAK